LVQNFEDESSDIGLTSGEELPVDDGATTYPSPTTLPGPSGDREWSRHLGDVNSDRFSEETDPASDIDPDQDDCI